MKTNFYLRNSTNCPKHPIRSGSQNDHPTESHIAKTDSGSETSGSVHLPLKKLTDRDDPRRLVTNRHSREATMHTNDESNTNKQAKKVCENSLF